MGLILKKILSCWGLFFKFLFAYFAFESACGFCIGSNLLGYIKPAELIYKGRDQSQVDQVVNFVEITQVRRVSSGLVISSEVG